MKLSPRKGLRNALLCLLGLLFLLIAGLSLLLGSQSGSRWPQVEDPSRSACVFRS